MARWSQLLVISVGLLHLAPAYGQTTLSIPHDAKFVIQVDVSALAHTKLGEQLLQLTLKLSREEIGSGDEDVLRKVEEALGFNPLEEIRDLTIIGSNYKNPEDGLQLMLKLGKTTGNLEGLMLALPGYDSEDVGDYTIHSAHNDGVRAYAASHPYMQQWRQEYRRINETGIRWWADGPSWRSAKNTHRNRE